MFSRKKKQFSIHNHNDSFLLRFGPTLIYSITALCVTIAIIVPPQSNNGGRNTETITITQHKTHI